MTAPSLSYRLSPKPERSETCLKRTIPEVMKMAQSDKQNLHLTPRVHISQKGGAHLKSGWHHREAGEDSGLAGRQPGWAGKLPIQ